MANALERGEDIKVFSSNNRLRYIAARLIDRMAS